MPLRLEHVTYSYSPGTAYEIKALDDVSLTIDDDSFVGIIGHTGSGKSTLVQHLNGLLRATEGKIYWGDQDIYAPDYQLRKLRLEIGMVFQYPEHQLFETTVFEDICFGPKNQGLSLEDAKKAAEEALELVHFPKRLYENSPFDLSGGQKRRAAIAGVLAMRPRILILDEPTAGLDPRGRDEILDLVRELHEQSKITVILVSHSMEDVANYVDRIIVMDEGRARFDGSPKEVFAHYRELEAMGLAAPQVTYLVHDLAEAGFDLATDATTVEEARAEILKNFAGKDQEASCSDK
ncbi:energy-coupling factor transporter ATPase [Shuttleworthella satelles]|uniref:Energy-coupling factor transporter ATP-binding protein EcfA2 n=1 Tax=Shuttleworthella satelles DSM 14600 TaxID=626523 RepID=C4GDY9_9FIRM|nr:energy-coupling factor transporter ATPase [Shuttleworthia satelles]EEP27618.1 ABC transporter, ATP-binding protein [Shuttleworthia satelles DSM 14600]